jgi:hypothetical protein
VDALVHADHGRQKTAKTLDLPVAFEAVDSSLPRAGNFGGVDTPCPPPPNDFSRREKPSQVPSRIEGPKRGLPEPGNILAVRSMA